MWIQEKTSDEAYSTPYKFTGKEQDAETGLYYYGARYYDPVVSRWLSVDPILDSYLDGKPNYGVFNQINLNLYSYCSLNPVKFVDPDGKWFIYKQIGYDGRPYGFNQDIIWSKPRYSLRLDYTSNMSGFEKILINYAPFSTLSRWLTDKLSGKFVDDKFYYSIYNSFEVSTSTLLFNTAFDSVTAFLPIKGGKVAQRVGGFLKNAAQLTKDTMSYWNSLSNIEKEKQMFKFMRLARYHTNSDLLKGVTNDHDAIKIAKFFESCVAVYKGAGLDKRGITRENMVRLYELQLRNLKVI